MLDDLEDLLDDNNFKPAPKANTSFSNKSGSKAPAASSGGKKKNDDLDDLDFDTHPKGSGFASGAKKQNNLGLSQASFGAGKKEDKKDEWGEWGFEDKPVAQKSYGGQSKEEPRSSVGSYTGFGVLGKQKPQERPGTGWGKPKKDDDDLDSILDGLAKEKKVELEKPPEKRPKTSDARNVLANQKSKFKSSVDPWDRDNFDELEDHEEKKTKAPTGNTGQRQRPGEQANKAMQDKRNALFGLQTSGDNYDPQPPQKGNATSKSVGRIDKDAPLFTSYNIAGQDAMGTIGNISGSQDSQIETLEVAGSRANKMRRIPQRTPSAQDQQKSASQGRPPTGNVVSQAQPQFLYSGDAMRVQTSPIGMMQQNPQQQNFQIAPLQRPQTGNLSGFGKPPRSGYGIQEEDDSNVLDLLGERKDASYKGSIGSGGAGPGFYASIEHDDAQFERFEEGGDDEANSPKGSDNSDLIGGYMPTAIQKAAPEQSKKKPIPKMGDRSHNMGGNSLVGSVLGGDLTMSDKEQKKQATIHSDQEGKPKSEHSQLFSKQNTMQQQQIMMNPLGSIGSQGTIQTQPILIQNNSLPYQSPQISQLPILDEKQLIQRQIEEERLKIKSADERHRKQLDDMREQHKKMMKVLEEKQSSKLSVFNEEKRKLIEDMNKTIELEKEKLSNLHRIDVENREIQYKKNLKGQKGLYEEQHSSLKKQLEQQVQLNLFAQDIQKSSGSINQLVTKLSTEQEGELRRREDDLKRREKEYMDKKKVLQERRQQIEMRKKKLDNEIDEVQHKQSEGRLDYERERGDILNDIDKIEGEHQQNIREMRNKNIEIEVEIRRSKIDREKITSQAEKEDNDAAEQLEILIQRKKQIMVEKEEFRSQMVQQENELKYKLREIKEREREIDDDDRIFLEKLKQFESDQKRVQEDHEKLQDQLDKYCVDRQVFDREAQKVKEQGEKDQIDSEKIGFFKANKDRLKDELRQLREDLESERDAMREDRIKLDMYKNELKTRQKTIETMRYEYIKSGPDSQHRFLDDARDLGYYNIQKQSETHKTFYPINPPKFDQRKDLIQESNTKTFSHQKTQAQQEQRYQGQTYIPRFRYEDYMKNLKDKLAQSAPVTTHLASDFQMYVLKERETYLKGLNDYDLDQPLVQSISHFKSYHKQPEDGYDASFNIGSLQNSQNAKKAGLINSNYGKNSTNSLHFMSKNFSHNSPVEEVDRDKGKFN